jgi:hypothetical protein
MTDAAPPTDDELFHHLWAGALFDIISAVLTECADKDREYQNEMIYRIVKELALRYELTTYA